MGLKVTLQGGKVLSVVPVEGQTPEEALEGALPGGAGSKARAIVSSRDICCSLSL